MQLLMQLVNRAAERGQSEVQVYRFPNALCSDRGRRINNSDARMGHDPGGSTHAPATNSGAITSGRWGSISGLKCSTIRGGCPAISASFLPGSANIPFRLGDLFR